MQCRSHACVSSRFVRADHGVDAHIRRRHLRDRRTVQSQGKRKASEIAKRAKTRCRHLFSVHMAPTPARPRMPDVKIRPLISCRESSTVSANQSSETRATRTCPLSWRGIDGAPLRRQRLNDINRPVRKQRVSADSSLYQAELRSDRFRPQHRRRRLAGGAHTGRRRGK